MMVCKKNLDRFVIVFLFSQLLIETTLTVRLPHNVSFNRSVHFALVSGSTNEKINFVLQTKQYYRKTFILLNSFSTAKCFNNKRSIYLSISFIVMFQ